MSPSLHLLLQKIREKPGLYLGKPSLEALYYFWFGYGFREDIEEWEKWSGRDYFENWDRVMSGKDIQPSWRTGDNFSYKFDIFVHAHYNRPYTTRNWKSLISDECNTDEEAFNKFFELLDEYLKHSE